MFLKHTPRTGPITKSFLLQLTSVTLGPRLENLSNLRKDPPHWIDPNVT